jgi:sarcosine oxidase subunit alpha
VRFVRTDTDAKMIRCDTVLISDGWTPSVHLFSQSRGKLRFDTASGTFLPGSSAAAEQSVGACAGMFDLAACLADGHRAGGGEPRTFEITGEPRFGASVPPSPRGPHGKAFVDFQNDVTTKDLAIATGEGFRAIEHVKRYTTAGTATDQGKTANVNALSTVAALMGQAIPEIGLTTFRPPYTPVTFGTFAGVARGDLFDPIRRTPIDDQDAVFENVGNWKRAHYFPLPGETMQQAVTRECRPVRDDLGLFDASTLGKIEVVDPDAAEFLNRTYTGEFTGLEPGRCKYGLLLGEDGFIRDDGVIARLARDRFHITTTTGGAASVLHRMEDYLQTEFPTLRVWLTSVTEQWAVIALQGPRAADALAPFLDGIDLTAMPHMSVREGRFAGVPTRLFRVSFSGELGFEINLSADFAGSAWDLLRETGTTRYGTEAMHVLRAEKGFIVVGQETDGTVVPYDLGLSRTIARSKPDFVGKRSLVRPDMLRSDRKQLVGLLADVVLEEGAQLTDTGTGSLGHVTSAYHSAALNRPIALALLSGGLSRTGTKLRVPLADGIVAVTVTEPIFYNPSGERMTKPITGSLSRTESVAGTEELMTPPIAGSPARTTTVASTGEQMSQRITGSPAPTGSVTGTGDRMSQSISEPPARTRTAASTASQPPPTLLATSYAPPVTSHGADVNLALAAATGKFSIRTQQPIAPTLRAATSDSHTALWLGPDEYLVFAEEPPDIAAGSIVDVSHRTVGFRVNGPRTAWCLNAFCALDLDTAPTGFCTRTLFGKAEIILWRVAEMEFHIETARSFASYVWALLEEARREFLPPPPAC